MSVVKLYWSVAVNLECRYIATHPLDSLSVQYISHPPHTSSVQDRSCERWVSTRAIRKQFITLAKSIKIEGLVWSLRVYSPLILPKITLFRPECGHIVAVAAFDPVHILGEAVYSEC